MAGRYVFNGAEFGDPGFGTYQVEAPNHGRVFAVRKADMSLSWYTIVPKDGEFYLYKYKGEWRHQDDYLDVPQDWPNSPSYDENQGFQLMNEVDKQDIANCSSWDNANTLSLDIKVMDRATSNICVLGSNDELGGGLKYSEWTLDPDNDTFVFVDNKNFSSSWLNQYLDDNGTEGQYHKRKISLTIDNTGLPWIFIANDDCRAYTFCPVSVGDKFGTWRNPFEIADASGASSEEPTSSQQYRSFNCTSFRFYYSGAWRIGIFYGSKHISWRISYRADTDAWNASWTEVVIEDYENEGTDAGEANDWSRNDDHVCVDSRILPGDTESTIVWGGKTGSDKYHLMWYKGDSGSFEDIQDTYASGHDGNTLLTRPMHFINSQAGRIHAYGAEPFQPNNATSTSQIHEYVYDLGTGELVSTRNTMMTGISSANGINNPFGVSAAEGHLNGTNEYPSVVVPIIATTYGIQGLTSARYVYNHANCQAPAIEYIYGCQDDTIGRHPDVDGYCSWGYNSENYTDADDENVTDVNEMINNPSFDTNPNDVGTNWRWFISQDGQAVSYPFSYIGGTQGHWLWSEANGNITHVPVLEGEEFAEVGTAIGWRALVPGEANIVRGARYRVVVNISNRTAGSISVQIGNSVELHGETNHTGTFTQTVIAKATDDSLFDKTCIILLRPTNDFDGSINSVSVKPLLCTLGLGTELISNANDRVFSGPHNWSIYSVGDGGTATSSLVLGKLRITMTPPSNATNYHEKATIKLDGWTDVATDTFTDAGDWIQSTDADGGVETAIPTNDGDVGGEGWMVDTDENVLRARTDGITNDTLASRIIPGITPGQTIRVGMDVMPYEPTDEANFRLMVMVGNNDLGQWPVGTSFGHTEEFFWQQSADDCRLWLLPYNIEEGRHKGGNRSNLHVRIDNVYIRKKTPFGMLEANFGYKLSADIYMHTHSSGYTPYQNKIRFIVWYSNTNSDSYEFTVEPGTSEQTYEAFIPARSIDFQIDHIKIQAGSELPSEDYPGYDSGNQFYYTVDNVSFRKVTSGGFSASNKDHKATAESSCFYGTSWGVNDEPGNDPVPGCTDPSAINFNPNATENDGTCYYSSNDDGSDDDDGPGEGGGDDDTPVSGCTDFSALNYNPNATVDDGTCEYTEQDDDTGLGDDPQPGEHILTKLLLRLNDDEHHIWDLTVKINALNDAQFYVASMVHDGYLKELEKVKYGIPLYNGKISFTNANIHPFRGKIYKVYDHTANDWCSMLPSDEMRKLTSSYYLPERGQKPLVYIDEDMLNTVPASESIDVFYLKNPQEINDEINTELNPALHHAIVCYAEYILWLMDNKKDRAENALSICTGILDALNQNYEIGGEGD